MYPAPFNYYRPSSLEDAIALLAELGEEAKVISGGQTLIPMLKLRIGEPAPIVDIAKIPGLNYIQRQQDHIHIGALTPHKKIANSELAKELAILKDCGGGIADSQVRARGTIGGSLSAADPNCDWPTLMRALNADVICTGPEGQRSVKIDDFITDAYTTSLKPSELVTEVRFLAPVNSGAYVVFKKAAPAYPTASAAVILQVDSNDVCRHAQFALGCCAGVAVRCNEAEDFLLGKAINPENLTQAGDLLVAQTTPKSDTKGSAEYKKQLLHAVFIEAANRALDRSHGKSITQGHFYA